MLYHLLYPLTSSISFFNIFRYITFRTAYATITALLISLILGPIIIRKLKGRKISEKIRAEGPTTHLAKEGTPTMGGLIILISVVTTKSRHGTRRQTSKKATRYFLIVTTSVSSLPQLPIKTLHSLTPKVASFSPFRWRDQLPRRVVRPGRSQLINRAPQMDISTTPTRSMSCTE